MLNVLSSNDVGNILFHFLERVLKSGGQTSKTPLDLDELALIEGRAEQLPQEWDDFMRMLMVSEEIKRNFECLKRDIESLEEKIKEFQRRMEIWGKELKGMGVEIQKENELKENFEKMKEILRNTSQVSEKQIPKMANEINERISKRIFQAGAEVKILGKLFQDASGSGGKRRKREKRKEEAIVHLERERPLEREDENEGKLLDLDEEESKEEAEESQKEKLILAEVLQEATGKETDERRPVEMLREVERTLSVKEAEEMSFESDVTFCYQRPKTEEIGNSTGNPASNESRMNLENVIEEKMQEEEAKDSNERESQSKEEKEALDKSQRETKNSNEDLLPLAPNGGPIPIQSEKSPKPTSFKSSSQTQSKETEMDDCASLKPIEVRKSMTWEVFLPKAEGFDAYFKKGIRHNLYFQSSPPNKLPMNSSDAMKSQTKRYVTALKSLSVNYFILGFSNGQIGIGRLDSKDKITEMASTEVPKGSNKLITGIEAFDNFRFLISTIECFFYMCSFSETKKSISFYGWLQLRKGPHYPTCILKIPSRQSYFVVGYSNGEISSFGIRKSSKEAQATVSFIEKIKPTVFFAQGSTDKLIHSEIITGFSLVSSRPHCFLSCSYDGIVNIIQIHEEQLQRIQKIKHPCPISSMVWVEVGEGKFVIVGDYLEMVSVYRIKEGNEPKLTGLLKNPVFDLNETQINPISAIGHIYVNFDAKDIGGFGDQERFLSKSLVFFHNFGDNQNERRAKVAWWTPEQKAIWMESGLEEKWREKNWKFGYDDVFPRAILTMKSQDSFLFLFPANIKQSEVEMASESGGDLQTSGICLQEIVIKGN